MIKLSSSGIKLFKACRRAYQFRYIYDVVPVNTSDALAMGSSYHKILEDLYGPDHIIPPEVPTTKAEAMAAAYYKYIYPDMPAYEPEWDFEVSFGRGKRITGRLDGLIPDMRAIVEHKTTSKNLDEFEFDLQMDEQIMTYFLATGFTTAFYTVCRKPTIRQKTNETDEEFAERCRQWYDEETAEKIRMMTVTRTAEEISAFAADLKQMFDQVKTAEKHGQFYRNTCNCMSYGRRCEYAPICLHYDPNEQYIDFERRTDHANHENF